MKVFKNKLPPYEFTKPLLLVPVAQEGKVEKTTVENNLWITKFPGCTKLHNQRCSYFGKKKRGNTCNGLFINHLKPTKKDTDKTARRKLCNEALRKTVTKYFLKDCFSPDSSFFLPTFKEIMDFTFIAPEGCGKEELAWMPLWFSCCKIIKGTRRIDISRRVDKHKMFWLNSKNNELTGVYIKCAEEWERE